MSPTSPITPTPVSPSTSARKDFAQLVDLFEHLTEGGGRQRTFSDPDPVLQERPEVPVDLGTLIESLKSTILRPSPSVAAAKVINEGQVAGFRDSGYWEPETMPHSLNQVAFESKAVPRTDGGSNTQSHLSSSTPTNHVFTFTMTPRPPTLLAWAAQVHTIVADSQARFRPLPQELRPRKWKAQAERKRRLSDGGRKKGGENKVEMVRNALKKRCVMVNDDSPMVPGGVSYVLFCRGRNKKGGSKKGTGPENEENRVGEGVAGSTRERGLEEMRRDERFREGMERVSLRERVVNIMRDDGGDSDEEEGMNLVGESGWGSRSDENLAEYEGAGEDEGGLRV